MTEPKASGEALKEYADKFLTALARIAAAIEGNRTYDAVRGAPSQDPPPPPPPPPMMQPTVAVAVDVTPATAHAITYDQISAAVMKYSDRFGHEAGKALVKRFGATYIKMIKVEDYPAVLAAIEAGP